MKAYLKLGLTVALTAALLLLSGFRAQTIIHDDGSETQDVLKVSETAQGQKKLRADADDFQKRNYTIMDYSNGNGEGFRAMKTITKDGANKSSVDRIVHKTHDGLICSTYYIDYSYTGDSIQALRLGMPIEENGADLEYIVSFPSGTQVTSNSTQADTPGSTYMWSLHNDTPSQIKLQATVWHKLFIYIALFLIAAVIVIVLIMERRRRNVISWKRAAHMRKVEILLLCIPIVILGYMGYEYYVGTHVTADSLAKVSEQQQEELLESREEDKKMHDVNAAKQRSGEIAASRIRSKTMEISSSLRELNRDYQSGSISRSEARSQAKSLASQAQELLASGKDLSEADKDVLQQLVARLVDEADSIGSGSSAAETVSRNVSEERQQSDSSTTETRSSTSSSQAANTSTANSAGSNAKASAAKAAPAKDANKSTKQ